MVFVHSNISSNAGSGILLRFSFLKMEGEFTFRENSAVTGGAINIRDGSKVSTAYLQFARGLKILMLFTFHPLLW